MDQDSTTPLSSSLNRRRVLAGTAGIGAAALLGVKLVQAQDSTATPGAGTSTSEETDEQTYYDNFVSKLAANLNISDAAAVDQAIRDSLTQIVDEELAGGHISQDAANKMKENIASGDVPFLFPGRHGRYGKHHHGHSGKNDEKKNQTDDTDTDDATEATPTSA